jgi:transcriptional regulator with XRE-family HTH domain
MINSNFVKNARLCLGLTQAELARKLECSQQAVSDWETGYRNPSKLVIKLLSQWTAEIEEE